MTEERIARLNELARKSKAEGLTEAKKPSSRRCAGNIWMR